MKNIKKISRKGFTLIELLVVIAILAVLAVVVVLTLNPAGLLQEARDSNRISDMASIKSAISLYMADVTVPALAPSSTICYVSVPTVIWSVTWASNTRTATTTCDAWFPSANPTVTTIMTSTPNRAVNATTGWVPVNLSSLSAGSPLAQWPIDPVNSANFFYSYIASTTTNVFKVAMFMESAKFQTSGTADVEGTDGGSDPWVFEGGSSLSL